MSAQSVIESKQTVYTPFDFDPSVERIESLAGLSYEHKKNFIIEHHVYHLHELQNDNYKNQISISLDPKATKQSAIARVAEEITIVGTLDPEDPDDRLVIDLKYTALCNQVGQ